MKSLDDEAVSIDRLATPKAFPQRSDIPALTFHVEITTIDSADMQSEGIHLDKNLEKGC